MRYTDKYILIQRIERKLKKIKSEKSELFYTMREIGKHQTRKSIHSQSHQLIKARGKLKPKQKNYENHENDMENAIGIIALDEDFNNFIGSVSR